MKPGGADKHTMKGQTATSDLFTTETTGLRDALPPQVIRLSDGDQLDLRITPVRKRIDDAELRMLGYNGSIPGPTLRVDQGSEITVQVTNDGDVEATVHWHGLRLENRYDGVPHETQAPIPIGGTFTYKVQFPDAGFYWYHPHIREDFALEMGLYGTIVVEPSDPSYWPATDRHLSITLDDVLVEDGRIAPFRRSGPNFIAMGRFGNVMLINGETTFSGEAAVGEVVRLYLVNTANTRIFNFAVPGARMKLIGGRVVATSARRSWTRCCSLPRSGRSSTCCSTPPGRRASSIAPRIRPTTSARSRSRAPRSAVLQSFEVLRVDPELASEHEAIETDLERAPDKMLAFVASVPLLYGEGVQAASYVCPMHPEVRASEPETCPKCGMRLVPSDALPGPRSLARAMTMAATIMATDLKWEDLMPKINRASDPSNVLWKLIDHETGAENDAISWAFTVGERVKIRLVNEMDSDHPMHHPFHVHGAGRFLVLSRDGEPESNLVWKDTVLLRAGETMNILLDVTNPGLWMAHCHIAEHTESGMMFSFNVSRRDPAEART